MLVSALAQAADKRLFSTVRATDLRKGPDESSAVLGRIPKGTVVKHSGKAKGDYLEVEVELTQGSVEGWIPAFAAPARVRDESGATDDGPSASGEPRRSEPDEPTDSYRPVRRVKIPSDEGLLMRREPSFFYGVQGGGGLSILSAPAVSANFFMGPAIMAGAHAGYFLSRVVPVRFEVNYHLLNGNDPEGKAKSIAIGFIQVSGSISYYLEQFELFGGVGYGLGISVGDIDPKIKINSAQDFSGLFFHGGLGYLVPLSDISNLAIRVRYDFGFNQAYVAPQAASAMLYLEFRG